MKTGAEQKGERRKEKDLYEASLLRVDPLCPAEVALKKIRFATFLMRTHLKKAPISRSPFTDSYAASPAHAKVASAAVSLTLLSRLLFPLVDRTQDAQLGCYRVYVIGADMVGRTQASLASKSLFLF